MSRMQSLVLAGLLACSLVTFSAVAQVPGEDLNGPPQAEDMSPQSQQLPPAQRQQRAGVQRFIDRFHAANATGDGRLTLAQAQAGNMPMIVRRFDAIDAQHKGYITLQDIRTYRQEMRAAHQGRDEDTVN